ncbi:MAG: hypothetical protein AAGI54_14985 [Planctomycetota bacterium]
MTARPGRVRRRVGWGAVGLCLALLSVGGCDRQPPSATDAERRAYALDAELEDARDAIHRGDIDAALAAVERARAVDPESYRPLVVRGRVLMREGQPAKARAAYESAARLADQAAAVAVERSAMGPTDEGEDDDPEAALERRRRAIKDAADARLAAGTARLMSVFAEASERGPAAELSEEGLIEAKGAYERAAETADLLGDEGGRRSTDARLHVALITALQGERDSATTQIDMLEVGHGYDADLAAFWRSVIRDGTLRARLTQDEPAP